MQKREAGPGGPACGPELFEHQTPDPAPGYHKSDCNRLQPCPAELFRQYGNAMSGIDPVEIAYDSGWDDSADVPVRVVIGVGPEDPNQREWVRRLAFGAGEVSDAG